MSLNYNQWGFYGPQYFGLLSELDSIALDFYHDYGGELMRNSGVFSAEWLRVTRGASSEQKSMFSQRLKMISETDSIIAAQKRNEAE